MTRRSPRRGTRRAQLVRGVFRQVTPLEVALYDAVAAADVFSRLCMKQDAYQEFSYYTISIRKEMLQKPVARQ